METFVVDKVEDRGNFAVVHTRCGKSGTVWEEKALLSPGLAFQADMVPFNKNGKSGHNFRNVEVNMSTPRAPGLAGAAPASGGGGGDSDRQARIEHQSLRRDLIAILVGFQDEDYPHSFGKPVIREMLKQELLKDNPSPATVGPVVQAALDAGGVVEGAVVEDDNPFE